MKTWLRGIFACTAVFLLSAVPAAGQLLADYDYDRLAFQGAGMDYGYIWPNRVDPTPAYTLRVDLGFLGPGVRLVPSLTYWSSKLKEEDLARFAEQLSRLGGGPVSADDLGTIDRRSISLALDAHLVWVTSLGIFTYVGLGPGLHLLDGNGEVIDGTFVEDLLDSVSAGAAAMAGAEYLPTQWLRLYAEGRYTLLSDLRYPTVRIGAAFTLPGGSE